MRALTLAGGEELHADGGNLVGIHFGFAVHAFAGCLAGVVEGAQTFELYGAAFGHDFGHHVGQGADDGVHVGGADGGLTRQTLGHFLRFCGLAHKDELGKPQAVQFFLNFFEE